MSERVLAGEPAFRNEDGYASSEAIGWPGTDGPSGTRDGDDGESSGFSDVTEF